MAKKKIRKLTAEENAQRDRLMERVRARIAEREAIEERTRLERDQKP
jgi:hypothetical protein